MHYIELGAKISNEIVNLIEQNLGRNLKINEETIKEIILKNDTDNDLGGKVPLNIAMKMADEVIMYKQKIEKINESRDSLEEKDRAKRKAILELDFWIKDLIRWSYE